MSTIDKVISVKCESAALVEISNMKWFQGKLKNITSEKFSDLKNSLIKNGIASPFNLWKKPDGTYEDIEDGHHRWLALQELRKEGWLVPKMPVSFILAKDKEEAARLLLVNNSRYARMSEESISDFMIDFELSVEDLEFLDLPDIDMSGFNIDGGEVDDADSSPSSEKPKLADRFLIPPFTVLNAREGWWQNRKRQWIALGIKSEKGRGEVNSGGGLGHDSPLMDTNSDSEASKQASNRENQQLQESTKTLQNSTLGAIATNQKYILKRSGKYKI